MWEVVRKNKIKSIIALIIMAIWYSLVYGIVFGLIVAFLIIAFSKTYDLIAFIGHKNIYYIGVAIALIVFIRVFNKEKNKPYKFPQYTMLKSRKSANKQLHNIVEEMVIASGLHTIPNIYILNSNILNAYACGINPKNASIVVSKGLLEALTRDELQGVIAHEIGHIANRDTTYLLCSGAMHGISAECSYTFYEGIKQCDRGLVFWVPLFLISSIGQVICFLLLMFISRKREYIADASACIYTRYPKGLADALLKIEASYEKSYISYIKNFKLDHLVKASLICPIKKQKDSILSTHPSTQNRIKLLLNMKTADAIEYERNFRKLNNNKKLLPRSTIKNSKKIKIREAGDIAKPLEISSACAINSLINSDKKIDIIKANKDLFEENVKKHKEIKDSIYALEEYIIINCDCGTILKVPEVYKNTIVICPHCKKKHPVGIKVE